MEDHQMDSNEAQQEMMDAANGDETHTNGDKVKPAEDEDERKLFIGGLSHGTTVDTVKQYFAKYGEVTKVDLKYDFETKKSRGFGFVTFAASYSLDTILKEGSHVINGKSIDPKKAMARPKPPPMKKVFIGGLSPEVTEDVIREHFGKHGNIEKTELPVDKETNKRRQFAFIVFETEEAAKNAVRLAKQKIGNMAKECDIKLATPPAPKDGPGGRFPMQMGGGGAGRFNGPPFGSPGARGGRGGGRGGFQGNQGSWGNQYGGPADGFNNGPNGGSGFGGQNQGYQGYSGGYDYQGGYNGGYSGGYDNSYWNYGGNGGGGYNQQNSGYGKVKRGAGSGSQGYHPYSQ